MRWYKPQALRPGAPLRLVAPSGPFDRASFDVGLARIASRYRPVFDDSLFSKARYLAGADEVRGSGLQEALADPAAPAILAARGGFGATRLLPSLSVPSGHTPLLMGFSDITALHALFQRDGRMSLHAPVLTQLGRQPDEVFERWVQLCEIAEPAPQLLGNQPLVPGVAEGRLMGGNLEVFSRLLGTPFLPDLTGALLLLEDVGERPYKLDRLWTHLRLAGVFERVAGIVLGDFTGCEEKDADYSGADVLADLARETGLPCAAGFPVGHGAVNQPVPLGVRARLDAGAATLSFLEPLVEE
ncbi:MAG TPA: LD-carboxypeptidase [Myxococcaceae bacterium]|nr:LD-carboxypeptidase [Myxococcaceae bacterium]